MNLRDLLKKVSLIIICLFIFYKAPSQEPLFKNFPFDSLGIIPYQLYTTIEDVMYMTNSIGIWKLKGHRFGRLSVSDGKLYDSKGRLLKPDIKNQKLPGKR